MNKQEAIKNYFGDRLKKIPKDVISNEISDTNNLVLFLTEMGLIEGFEGITFYFESPSIQKIEINGKEYLVLGDDYGTKLCAELTSENIFSVDVEGELPTRYINSSIENFILFIMIFEQYQKSLDEDEDENMNKLSELQSTFNKYDKAALDGEENWWSVIIEQIDDGLL